MDSYFKYKVYGDLIVTGDEEAACDVDKFIRIVVGYKPNVCFIMNSNSINCPMLCICQIILLLGEHNLKLNDKVFYSWTLLKKLRKN